LEDGSMGAPGRNGTGREAADAACDPVIGRQAEDRLRRSGYLALRDVTCDSREGVVSLRGRLRSYYLKQLAQSLVASVEGVLQVHNHIEIIAPAENAPAGRDRTARPD
jgi:osmotically-inducible protein OsmY